MREVTCIEDLVCETCIHYNSNYGQCGWRWIDARDVDATYFCGEHGMWYVLDGVRSRAAAVEVLLYTENVKQKKAKRKKPVDKEDVL